MVKNATITIEKVGNGFLVSPAPSFNNPRLIAPGDRNIFRNLTALGRFLREHFPSDVPEHEDPQS